MKTFDLNNNNEYGEGNGSCVLSKDNKNLYLNSVEYHINSDKSKNAIMKINKFDLQNKSMKTLDSIYIPNKGIHASISWRGGLVVISDTSYVLAYQVADTFSQNKLTWKYYLELYCFTENGDSLWTYTYPGHDSLAYLSYIYCSNNFIYITGSDYFKRNSLQCSGFELKLNINGNLVWSNLKTEEIGGINAFVVMHFINDTSILSFSSLPLTGVENEGKLFFLKKDNSILDSIFLNKGNYNCSLLNILNISAGEITYSGMWDTSYPYDPKKINSLHYVYYISKINKTGKLINRYFLDDGNKQFFFNYVHSIKQKNGNYLILLNENSKDIENSFGNVNIGLYCMDSNGTILWKRKYYTHRRGSNDTYSSDLVLNDKDDIFITGFANNVYDTTDLEWDILVIAADKNGCIDKNDCENFYIASTKEIITPYKIPFVLYPNPSAEDFFVLLSEPAVPSTEVNIFNVEGKNIYSYNVEPGVLDIHIQNFKAAKGEYILEVKDKRGVVGSKKLVRE